MEILEKKNMAVHLLRLSMANRILKAYEHRANFNYQLLNQYKVSF